jgi:MFS family permease
VYPSLKDVRNRSDVAPGDHPWWRPRVTGNVVALGVTSFFTDVSSEMVTSIVPLFLTFHLGFSRFQLGVFNGAYLGLAAFATILGSALADRYRRYKEVAGFGYALSAGSKLGLVAARNAWIPATGLLYADRTGKGLRTAPRDALISDSAIPGHAAEAFGVHRTLDTAGALAGPFLAFVILAAAPGAYGTIFTTSFWVALVGLTVLALFVRNPVRLPGPEPHRRPGVGAAFGLLAIPKFRRLVIAGVVLSLVTIGDALLYLTFQQRSSLSAKYFPLLFVGTATVYVLFAFPLGRMADRIGAARVYLAGQALLVIVYLALLRTDPGPVALVALLASLGLYYAATDGILAALGTSIVPPGMRASGLAVLNASMAIAALVASVLFGALWGWKGSDFAVTAFLVGLGVALVISAVLLRPLLRRSPHRDSTHGAAQHSGEDRTPRQ